MSPGSRMHSLDNRPHQKAQETPCRQPGMLQASCKGSQKLFGDACCPDCAYGSPQTQTQKYFLSIRIIINLIHFQTMFCTKQEEEEERVLVSVTDLAFPPAQSIYGSSAGHFQHSSSQQNCHYFLSSVSSHFWRANCGILGLVPP